MANDEMITDENREKVRQALDEARKGKNTIKSQYVLVAGYLDLIEQYQGEGMPQNEIWAALCAAESRLNVTVGTFKIYVQRAKREARKEQEGLGDGC